MQNVIDKLRTSISRNIKNPEEQYRELIKQSGIEEFLQEGHTINNVIKVFNGVYKAQFLGITFKRSLVKTKSLNEKYFRRDRVNLSELLIKKGEEINFYRTLLELYKNLEANLNILELDRLELIKFYVNKQLFLYKFIEELESRFGKIAIMRRDFVQGVDAIYIPTLKSFCYFNSHTKKDGRIAVKNYNDFILYTHNETFESLMNTYNTSEIYNNLTLSMYGSSGNLKKLIESPLILDGYLEENELETVLCSLNSLKVEIVRLSKYTYLFKKKDIIFWQGSGYYIYQDEKLRTIIDTDLGIFMRKLAANYGYEYQSHEYLINLDHFLLKGF